MSPRQYWRTVRACSTATRVSSCSLRTSLTRAKLHDSRLHQLPGIPSSADTANDSPSGLRNGLANPRGQCPSAGVAQCPHGGSNAAVVSEVVLDSCRFLLLRELGSPARIANWQVELLLVFVVPALQRIFCWITQLTDSGSYAFAKLDVELNGSNYLLVVQVFVRTPQDSTGAHTHMH